MNCVARGVPAAAAAASGSGWQPSLDLERAPGNSVGRMQTIELGRTGEQVSQLALGAMQMGNATGETDSARILDRYRPCT